MTSRINQFHFHELQEENLERNDSLGSLEDFVKAHYRN